MVTMGVRQRPRASAQCRGPRPGAVWETPRRSLFRGFLLLLLFEQVVEKLLADCPAAQLLRQLGVEGADLPSGALLVRQLRGALLRVLAVGTVLVPGRHLAVEFQGRVEVFLRVMPEEFLGPAGQGLLGDRLVVEGFR